MRRREQRVEAESSMDTIINNDGSNDNGTRQEQEVEVEVEAVSHLLEEITLLLSQWNGLQMAVQNEWGGHDSLQKAQQLAVDILSWLSQSKAPLYVDDLETMLHECMLLSLNTEIEDGSIEEVAEQLMIMHEEYLQGYQEIIEKYRGREDHP
ncbi:pre-rRNA-processing protein TSR2 homolog [Pistacia vera]|uniref:pre-rRNA-processing protein TSR2 homolog n=1 Tax=Pistacia vera TaxID=55513 RepID=UPI0012638659|nr:pre-rRNA-processing protein TSR2 homolog [Pistacia vera]